MVIWHYKKIHNWIEKNRFQLLLIATVLVLVLPAFSGSGMLSEILFLITMSFLFIQSMIAANVNKSTKRWIRIIVIGMILIVWLKPIGFESDFIDIFKLVTFVVFFIFVVIYLIKFISRSSSVDMNVLLTSVNIYLLVGIIFACLAFIFYRIYPNAYNLPASIDPPVFVNFLYYRFITMTTVGYGDITPCIQETQTLAYLMSVSGQFYVAIIIALLIGKYLLHSAHSKTNQNNTTNE
jgi:voltage-gated potassium channel